MGRSGPALVLAMLAGCGRLEFDPLTDAIHDASVDVLMPDAFPNIARTINFDVDTLGNPVDDGTVVDTIYAPWGITFERTGATVPSCSIISGIYANGTLPGISLPNQVSPCGKGVAGDFAENGGLGVVHAMFAAPQSMVCIDVRPDGAPDFAVLRLYDASDTMIGSALSTAGVTGPLCASASGIRGARFMGSGLQYCIFDNLATTP